MAVAEVRVAAAADAAVASKRPNRLTRNLQLPVRNQLRHNSVEEAAEADLAAAGAGLAFLRESTQ